jgi:hypothetical protein
MTVGEIFPDEHLFAEDDTAASAGELLCPLTVTHATTRSLITLTAFVKITPTYFDKSGELLQVVHRL